MEINNAFYDDLEDQWFEGQKHPIALLRAENRVRNPWIVQTIGDEAPNTKTVLDMGCGGGLLVKELVSAGFDTTGIDLSKSSLRIAQKSAPSANLIHGDVTKLPFKDASFDVVCAMDIIEHVEDQSGLFREAARVLKPGGLFFFHTFNKTLKSRLIVIKGVDWFMPGAPKNMHVYPLFISPQTLSNELSKLSIKVKKIQGLNLKVDKWFWKTIFTRTIAPELSFTFGNNLSMGYSGWAQKQTQR